jgi:hypothetical protein
MASGSPRAHRRFRRSGMIASTLATVQFAYLKTANGVRGNAGIDNVCALPRRPIMRSNAQLARTEAMTSATNVLHPRCRKQDLRPAAPLLAAPVQANTPGVSGRKKTKIGRRRPRSMAPP